MSDNLYLFANNNGTQAENNGSYRLYNMKIEGDAETRRDFQPVLDSNNIPCLLDRTNNKFYYNKSGEVFKTKEKLKYKKLKYVIGDGDNYIDLGKRTLDSNTKLEFKFQIPEVGMNSAIFRLYHFGKGSYAYRNGGLQYLYLPGKSAYEVQKIKAVDNPLTVITTSTKNIIGDTVVNYTTTENFTTTENLYLFSKFTTSMNYKDKVKLYYFKMYNGESLTLDLIPVLDQNNIPCMYDKVSDQFFYNQGTDTFGYEIEELEKAEVTLIEYLESTGTQYIDTGIPVYENSSYEIKVAVSNGGGYVFGISGLYNVGRTELNMDNKSCVPCMFSGDHNRYNFKNTTNRYPHTIKMTPTQLFIDGEEIQNFKWGSSIPDNTYKMRLFGYLKWDKPVVTKCVVYYFKTYRGEDLIQDLRPCLDTAGEPCMYDTVSKQYYYNQGTDQFIYGDIAEYTPVEYIESNGTQYIDTGVVPTANTNIDMTCRLSAKPYICFKDKCNTSTITLPEDVIIEMDFKYGGTRLGDSRALENYLYILEDGSYSLDGSTSTGVLASTSHYDNLKFILSLTDGKEYLYVNGIKVGEKAISSLPKLRFGGNFGNCATFYMHYANVYKKSDLTPIALLTPVMDDYAFSNPDYSYTYHIPKLYDNITGNYYMTSYGDATDMKYIDYGYDKNYIYNNLKLLNILKTQNSESNSDARKRNIYDRTVYEYNGINTTVKPNLVASEGATLTMGSVNLEYLTDDEKEQAINNGWSLL